MRNVTKGEAGVIGCVRGWNSGVERAGFRYKGIREGVALEGVQCRPQCWEPMRWRWNDERAEWEGLIGGESFPDNRWKWWAASKRARAK